MGLGGEGVEAPPRDSSIVHASIRRSATMRLIRPAPLGAGCGAGRGLMLVLLAGLATIDGFEIQLEYGDATPMTRAYRQQQKRSAASRRHLQRLGPNGAPPPRTLELGTVGGVYYVTL